MAESDDVEVFVDRDGTVTFVHDDDLAVALDGEGRFDTRRASHVEPTLRERFGEQGWIADMSPVGGPVLFDMRDGAPVPFRTRRAALDAERAWLAAHLRAGRVQVHSTTEEA